MQPTIFSNDHDEEDGAGTTTTTTATLDAVDSGEAFDGAERKPPISVVRRNKERSVSSDYPQTSSSSRPSPKINGSR